LRAYNEHHFCITPQAIRLPALSGWIGLIVVGLFMDHKSGAAFVKQRTAPSPSVTAAFTVENLAVPSALTSKFTISTACGPSGLSLPCCLAGGWKWPPADLKAGTSHLPTAPSGRAISRGRHGKPFSQSRMPETGSSASTSGVWRRKHGEAREAQTDERVGDR
jgi:hypothetical protein